MKSLLDNKKVKITLIVVLILIVLLLVIGIVVTNVNKINKMQDTELQANVDISSEVVISVGKDENGRDLGKVTLNFTSDIPMDKISIENVDGTIIQEDVNSTTYEKEISVVFGHTHIISVVTSDGKISMHKITKQKPPPISNPSTASGIRAGNKLNFTWEEINEIAEIISNDSSITNNTQEFSLNYKGNNYTIGVGDYTTLEGYKVRIMGFNHDTLASTNAYGAGKNNTYAGISFEFAEVWYVGQAETKGGSAGGYVKNWGDCSLRTTLNNRISSLENNIYIKQVRKKYIDNFHGGSTNEVQDKLWLLSNSEVFSGNSEGEQYKYYVSMNSAEYRMKSYQNVDKEWWLRSQTSGTYGYTGFYTVLSSGNSSRRKNYYSLGVAPGFCI